MNHVFEECPVFQAHQHFSEPMNAAFQGRTMILTLQRTILAGEITQISHGANKIMTTPGQTTSIIPILPIIKPTFPITLTILSTIFQIINKIFPTKLHHLPSRILNSKGE